MPRWEVPKGGSGERSMRNGGELAGAGGDSIMRNPDEIEIS